MLEHLKLLFGVAQHMLGLLEWPIADDADFTVISFQ